MFLRSLLNMKYYSRIDYILTVYNYFLIDFYEKNISLFNKLFILIKIICNYIIIIEIKFIYSNNYLLVIEFIYLSLKYY